MSECPFARSVFLKTKLYLAVLTLVTFDYNRKKGKTKSTTKLSIRVFTVCSKHHCITDWAQGYTTFFHTQLN